MSADEPTTILCLASYEKGFDFMREAKAQGARVYLLTTIALKDCPWPREALYDIFFIPDLYNRQHVLNSISYLARTHRIDRIVALDDFDVETAAAMREHLRVPGMGDSSARFFRDKLAMRMRAQEEGFRIPPFVHVLNYDRLHRYMEQVSPPWVLKPRSEASATGIKKIQHPDELWHALDILGDRQSHFVLEKYIMGDVYHVDSIIVEREIVLSEKHQYSHPPLDVVTGGGIFMSRTMQRGSADEEQLHTLNVRLVEALGLGRGIMHTEFIKGTDGEFYFLETAARVGGANIADMVEAARGVNLWREWAKVEIRSARKEPYELPPTRQDYGGVILSLARQEWPDTSGFTDPEIVMHLTKRHHIGFILRADTPERIAELQDDYARRIRNDFHAAMPAPERPTN